MAEIFNFDNLGCSEGHLKLSITNDYKDGYNLLIGVSDSLKFLRTIPDKSIKLIVTSPPYNIGKPYEERLDSKKYLKYYHLIANEAKRILREDGSLAWQVGNYVSNGEIFPLDILFYEIFKKDAGLKLRNRIIWRFEHGLHASVRLSGRYESILWFTKSDCYTFNLDSIRVPQKYPGKTYYRGEKKGQLSCNPLGKNPSDFWDILESDWDEEVWNIPNVKYNHPEKTIHPAQFPVELVQRLVLALTNEGDTVLDPFGGVGSSAVAALSLDRKAISVDRDRYYSEIALERITSMMKGTLKIRNLGTPISKPKPSSPLLHIPEEWLKLRETSFARSRYSKSSHQDYSSAHLSPYKP